MAHEQFRIRALCSLQFCSYFLVVHPAMKVFTLKSTPGPAVPMPCIHQICGFTPTENSCCIDWRLSTPRVTSLPPRCCSEDRYTSPYGRKMSGPSGMIQKAALPLNASRQHEASLTKGWCAKKSASTKKRKHTTLLAINHKHTLRTSRVKSH